MRSQLYALFGRLDPVQLAWLINQLETTGQPNQTKETLKSMIATEAATRGLLACEIFTGATKGVEYLTVATATTDDQRLTGLRMMLSVESLCYLISAVILSYLTDGQPVQETVRHSLTFLAAPVDRRLSTYFLATAPACHEMAAFLFPELF